MKVKTSVTLSEDLVREIDRLAGTACSRSEFIERSLNQHFRQLRREERNRRDAEIYAGIAADPTFESDVTDFSVDPMTLGDDADLIVDTGKFREAG